MDQYANLLTYSCIYTLRSRWQWTEKFVAGNVPEIYLFHFNSAGEVIETPSCFINVYTIGFSLVLYVADRPLNGSCAASSLGHSALTTLILIRSV